MRIINIGIHTIDSISKLLTIIIFSTLWMQHALADERRKIKPIVNDISKLACPSKDFAIFFEKFSNDENIQRGFTEHSLKETYIDASKLENDPVVKIIEYAEIKFPVFPLGKERQEYSLELRVINIAGNTAEVILDKPDTDYYTVSYHFSYKNDCWRLLMVEDHSL